MKKLPAILSVLAILSAQVHAQPDRIYKLHFSKLAVPQGQRVAAIQLKIACAHILDIDNIPVDWSIETVRAISAVEEFGAQAGHGASWLDDLKPLDGVITVSVTGDGASCFTISGTLLTEDDDRDHKQRLRFSDFRLEPRR